MAENDWTAFTAATHQALDATDVSKGVSNAFPKPPGGGTFVAVLHSLQSVSGVAGWYYSATSGFNPISGNKGGRISAAMKRYSVGEGYAPIMGFMSGTNIESSYAYVVGLSNNDPYQIVLKKGLTKAGLDSASSEVLRVSDESFSSNSLWFHLQLNVIVNPQGDVVLNVLRNEADVSSPVWEAIPGMDLYIDDALGVLSGTQPLISGFHPFFGQYNGGLVGKASMFDHIEIARQISP